MKIQIREIQNSDQGRWQELWKEYLNFYNAVLSEEQIYLTWQRLIDSNFNLIGLVAVIDDEILGIAHFLFRPSTWSKNHYCYLEDLFTDPTVRGQGIGRALINEVINRAQSVRSERVYWTTHKSNSQAQVLYDSFGYPSEFIQYRIPLIE